MLDDYSSHHSYEFECYCKKNNIVIFYIFLHLFHLFQSFDIGYFNMLKRLYDKEVENLIRFYINYIIKPNFFVCFYTTFFATFGEENIRVDFRGTDFVPFNLKTVIFKLDVKLYISIPTGLFTTEVDSWVSKTL